jgi:ribosomal protein S18 acetylase RimI-like enzyme
VRLVEIDRDNYRQAFQIELPNWQWQYVATPERSLAEAYVWSDARPRLVEVDGEIVGFVMTFPFEEDGERRLNLVRLVIDRRFQRRGLGRAVVERLLEEARREDIAAVTLSVHPDNAAAIALYRSAGFVQNGYDGTEFRFERRPA